VKHDAYTTSSGLAKWTTLSYTAMGAPSVCAPRID
jgi:hypothetical protein